MDKNLRGLDKEVEVLEAAIARNIPSLLIGETGTGKTKMVREAAKRHGKPFTRVNLNGETSIDDFVGRWTIQDGHTVWIDGVLPQAMRNGEWLLLDEINAALPEILFVLQSVLDDDRFLRLVEKNNEVVRPHEEFRIFATMNPADEYTGTKELNLASKNRWGVKIMIGYVHPEIEKAIVRDYADKLTDEELTIMVNLAVEVRRLKARGELSEPLSTRSLIMWGMMSESIGFYKAFIYTVLNALSDKDEAKKIRELFEYNTEQFKQFFASYGVSDYKSLMESLKEEIETAATVKREVDQARRRLSKMVEAETQGLEKTIRDAAIATAATKKR